MNSIISFFTGAGFLDLGFEHAGFRVDMVNEWDPNFLRGYRYAREQMGSPAPKYGHHLGSVEDFMDGPLRDVLKGIVADIRRSGRKVGFVGGPPCPDFSIAGKQAGSEGDNGRLTGVYFDIICDVKPDFYIFENVEGLWRTKAHREYYDGCKIQMMDAGFTLYDRLINSINYGAPQDRSRIFQVGVLNDLEGRDFPWDVGMSSGENLLSLDWPVQDPFVPGSVTQLPSPELPRHLTVEHWFRKNDVENHPNADMYFQPKSPKIAKIDEGDSYSKSFKRLHRWRYSPTACYGHNEVHLHPYKARRISVAESLALQSLPPSFELPRDMSLSAAFKTIGNGVPYLAAKGLAESVAAHLDADAPRIAQAA